VGIDFPQTCSARNLERRRHFRRTYGENAEKKGRKGNRDWRKQGRPARSEGQFTPDAPLNSHPPADRPRIAALVDLPRSPQAGGHVKWWERLADAAADERDALPFDLTVYFSGDGPEEALSPRVRLRHLKPVFSTAHLTFLPYTPEHADLAPFHPRLARELSRYDLVHATDGFFAFARTAERIARARNIPLTTSFHTDTPAYASIFTRHTIDEIFARWPSLRRRLVEDWRAPQRQEARMERRLERHLRAAARAFATRAADRRLAEGILGPAHVSRLRIGVNKEIFGPHRRDAEGVRRDYAIPMDRSIGLFVGRVDVGKNIPVLIEAAERSIASGAPLHLIVAGLGPLTQDLTRRLPGRVSLPGFLPPAEVGRLYASVDFCALPSEVEVGGMAAVEAIASGCPTLASRGGRSVEQFDGATGISEVDSGPTAWASALSDLATNASRRLAMREVALECRLRHLASWSDVLNRDLAPGWRAALSSF
jgi:glycosyltransferase involved in cell wall biosynthesis